MAIKRPCLPSWMMSRICSQERLRFMPSSRDVPRASRTPDGVPSFTVADAIGGHRLVQDSRHRKLRLQGYAGLRPPHQVNHRVCTRGTRSRQIERRLAFQQRVRAVQKVPDRLDIAAVCAANGIKDTVDPVEPLTRLLRKRPASPAERCCGDYRPDDLLPAKDPDQCAFRTRTQANRHLARKLCLTPRSRFVKREQPGQPPRLTGRQTGRISVGFQDLLCECGRCECRRHLTTIQWPLDGVKAAPVGGPAKAKANSFGFAGRLADVGRVVPATASTGTPGPGRSPPPATRMYWAALVRAGHRAAVETAVDFELRQQFAGRLGHAGPVT